MAERDLSPRKLLPQQIRSFVKSIHDQLVKYSDVGRISTSLHHRGAISDSELQRIGSRTQEARAANSALYLILVTDPSEKKLRNLSAELKEDSSHGNHLELAEMIDKYLANATPPKPTPPPPATEAQSTPPLSNISEIDTWKPVIKAFENRKELLKYPEAFTLKEKFTSIHGKLGKCLLELSDKQLKSLHRAVRTGIKGHFSKQIPVDIPLSEDDILDYIFEWSSPLDVRLISEAAEAIGETEALKEFLSDHKFNVVKFATELLGNLPKERAVLHADDNHAHLGIKVNRDPHDYMLAELFRLQFYLTETLGIDRVLFEGFAEGCTMVMFRLMKEAAVMIAPILLSHVCQLREFGVEKVIVFGYFAIDVQLGTLHVPSKTPTQSREKYKADMKSMEGMHHMTMVELDALKTKLGGKEEELSQSQNELKRAREELLKCRGEVKQLKELVDVDLVEKVESLKRQLEEKSSREKEEEKQTISDVAKELEALEEQVHNQKMRLVMTEDENNTLSKELSILKLEKERVEDGLLSEKKELKTELLSVTNKLDEITKQLLLLENEFQQLKEVKEDLCVELKRLKEKEAKRSRPTIGSLADFIPKMSPKWYELAHALDMDTLADSLKQRESDDDRKCLQILKEWINSGKNVSFERLYTALSSPLVGLPEVAKEIRSKVFQAVPLQECRDKLFPLTINTTQYPILHATGVISDSKRKLIICGATSPKREDAMKVFQFDMVSGEWQLLCIAPQYRCGVTCMEGSLIVIGGYKCGEEESQDTITNQVSSWILGDLVIPKKKEWNSTKYPSMHEKRFRPGVACHDNVIVVAGGTSKGPLEGGFSSNDIHDSVEVLKDGSKQWTLLKNCLPKPLFAASLSQIGEYLYLASGFNGEFTFERNAWKVKWQDLPTEIRGWECLKTQPPVVDASLLERASHPILIGGFKGQEASSDIFMYTDQDDWQRIGQLHHARGRPCVVAINATSFMVVGGTTSLKVKEWMKEESYKKQMELVYY